MQRFFNRSSISRQAGHSRTLRTDQVEQIEALLLEAARSQSATVLGLSGEAGVGKSHLLQATSFPVETLTLPIVLNAQQRNEPFSAIPALLQGLIHPLQQLRDGADALDAFVRENKDHIHLLRFLVPSLLSDSRHDEERIDETNIVMQNNVQRLCIVIRKLMAFCALLVNRPIVVSVDNAHYMDAASADLFHRLIQENPRSFLDFNEALSEVPFSSGISPRGFLLILSYQPALEEGTNFTNMLKDAPQIYLENLALGQVNEMVADWMQRSPNADTMELARVVFQKSRGNPFAVLQFMEILVESSLLYMDSSDSFQWKWTDPSEIQQRTGIVSHNAAELIVDRMQRSLTAETQSVLLVASCLGAQIPIYILQQFFLTLSVDDSVEEESKGAHPDNHSYLGNDLPHWLIPVKPKDVQAILEACVEMGILCPKQCGLWVWSHEQIQQAAYSQIEDHKQQLHEQLGNVLWDCCKTTPDNQEHGSSEEMETMSIADTPDWIVFLAADQLRQALSLRGTRHDVVSVPLAKLNLKAARISIRKSAFYAAADLLVAGIEHLGPTQQMRWKNHYVLCLELHSSLAEVHSYCGKYAESERISHEVVIHARSAQDTYRVEFLQANTAADDQRRDYKKKISMFIKLFNKQNGGGKQFPGKVNKIFFAKEKFFYQKKHPNFTWRDLDPKISPIQDEGVARSSQILNKIVFASISVGEYWTVEYACFRLLQLAFEHGPSIHTLVGVLAPCLRLRMEGKSKEVIERIEFGQRVGSRCEGTIDYARTMLVIHLSASHLTHPFHESLDIQSSSLRRFLAIGEMEYAFLSAMGYCFSYINTGLSLKPFGADVAKYIQLAEKFQIPFSFQAVFKIFHQTILNLNGEAFDPTNPCRLKGDAMDEDYVLTKLEGSSQYGPTLRDMSAFRLMLACIYDDAAAMEANLEALLGKHRKYEFYDRIISRGLHRATFVGYASLVLARRYKRKKFFQVGQKVKKDVEHQVSIGSPNAFPIMLVLRAVDENSKAAYQTAIVACARCGHSMLECLTRDGLRRLFLSSTNRGDYGEARAQLDRMIEVYQNFDALGKVKQLQEEFLIPASNSSSHKTNMTSSTRDCTSSFLEDNSAVHTPRQTGTRLKARERYDCDELTKQLGRIDLAGDMGLGNRDERQ